MLKIRTNNHWREFKYRCDVPKDVLTGELDWCDEETCWDGFLRYQGTWYHLSQFVRTHRPTMRIEYPHPGEGADIGDWHGFCGESAWGGVAIRLSEDGDHYQIARVTA